jgi:PH (Pleckstrin Homology) domain-containing protein
MGARDETFRSKVDAGLVLVVAGLFGWIWFSLAHRIWTGRSLDALDLFDAALVPALIVWILRTTYYAVKADDLLVHSGPFRRTVPLASISSLRATRNPRHAPALSLDRIEVRYGSKRLLVSPRDKRRFVRTIAERVPGVKLDGVSAA